MKNDDLAQYGDVGDVYERYRGIATESLLFPAFLRELRELAENGSAEASISLGSQLIKDGPLRNLEEAYRWFFIGYSLSGYSTTWDETSFSPYYSGQPGDFRNEVQVNEILELIEWNRCREIDSEANKWLKENGLVE